MSQMPLQGEWMSQSKPGTARELQSGAIRKIPVDLVHQLMKAKMLCQNVAVLAEITPGMSWEPQDPAGSSSHQESSPKPPGNKITGAKPPKGVEHHKRTQVSGQASTKQRNQPVKSAAPQAGNSSSPSPMFLNKAGIYSPLGNPSMLQIRQAAGQFGLF